MESEVSNGYRGLEVNPEETRLLTIPSEGEMRHALDYTTVEITMRVTGGTIPEGEVATIRFQPLKLEEDGQLKVTGHNRYSRHPLTDGLVDRVSIDLSKGMTTEDTPIFGVELEKEEG